MPRSNVVDERYVALAIPFFLALMAIEWAVLQRHGSAVDAAVPAYRFADSVTNLSCGIGQQILEPFFKAATLVPYTWAWSHARLFDVSPRSPWAWAALVAGLDLAFYVFHRASHRVGFLWAIHAVHHQSEEYNLSVALRQPWLQSAVAPLFYLPLAVAGFPPIMYLGAVTIDTLYQFWIHTRAIKSLGPLEWILNTPSHHRVHHGIDPEYLDRNYAGIFIVWDRMFGSFRREGREPVYGTVKPAASWNALGVNLAVWGELARMSRATARFSDKVRVWFAPPEWHPADLGGPIAVRETGLAPPAPGPPPAPARARYDVRAPRGVQVYVGVHLALAVVATMAYLWIEATAPQWFLVAAAAVFVATVVAWGGLLEGRRWAWPVEGARLAAAAAIALAYVHGA
jgi:sterol desaturase/sphingolipid hydroxylase (fatty acid hydroxylase superfamily)